MILTNPTSSLKEAQKLLDWFGRVSYYKLKTSKLHILHLKLDATTKNLLQVQYPFTWPDKSISYLGIHLTRSVKNLFSVNYKPLLIKLQTEIQSILKHKLSWSGRLAAFKILHLPQILYLFRTLPIPIPKYFFKSLLNSTNLYGKDLNLGAHTQNL